MRRYAIPVALGLVVLLGAALRLYALSSVPSELVVDEIDLYNSAHSIATTGRDLDGSLAPFLYCPLTRNPPVYAAAGYLSTLLFGKNAVALRLPAVLFGLAAVLLLYGIALELTRRRDVALLAALLMATQPLFVHFSRVAWEPAAELPFVLGGLYVLLRTLRRRDEGPLSLGGLALAAALLGLATYTYMAGWFYAALLGGTLLALAVARDRSAHTCAAAGAAALLWYAISAPGLWMWFHDPHTIERTQRIATFAGGVTPDALRVFLANYTAHLRWSYLVVTGDPQPGLTWRYLDGFGAFYGWVIPLAALGLAGAIRYARSGSVLAWLWIWLLAYPLGGALTNEGAPNAPRTLAGAPVFCILAAIGLVLIGEALAHLAPRLARIAVPAARVAFSATLALSVAQFSTFYFTRYVHLNPNGWDSGTRAMFSAVRARDAAYDRVCFSVYPEWYGIESYVRFYLEGVRARAVDDARDPSCWFPGTLLVTDAARPQHRPGFLPLGSVPDVDGNPFAVLSGRPR